jgi:hypothetical protein
MKAIDAVALSILEILYQIVKEEGRPLSYGVKPRELILHAMQDWNTIHASLIILEKEGYVISRQVDTLQILLTEKGLRWCQHQL